MSRPRRRRAPTSARSRRAPRAPTARPARRPLQCRRERPLRARLRRRSRAPRAQTPCASTHRGACAQRGADGSGSAYQSSPSGPSSTDSPSAASRTVRAIGPAWVKRKSAAGKCPVSGTRPWVGLSPTTPQ
jgi:hypothetical protein